MSLNSTYQRSYLSFGTNIPFRPTIKSKPQFGDQRCKRRCAVNGLRLRVGKHVHRVKLIGRLRLYAKLKLTGVRIPARTNSHKIVKKSSRTRRSGDAAHRTFWQRSTQDIVRPLVRRRGAGAKSEVPTRIYRGWTRRWRHGLHERGAAFARRGVLPHQRENVKLCSSGK